MGLWAPQPASMRTDLVFAESLLDQLLQKQQLSAPCSGAHRSRSSSSVACEPMCNLRGPFVVIAESMRGCVDLRAAERAGS